VAATSAADIADTGDAFTLLYGLVIQDTQIRVLLGDDPPSRRLISRRAETAVDRFFELTTVSPSR
jgi:hypothetical protein